MKVKRWRNVYLQVVTKKNEEWPHLYQTKIDFLSQKQSQATRRSLYNNKMVNSKGTYNNRKYICTQHQMT